jgi:ADP-heptose:LPS heptosyltransferase
LQKDVRPDELDILAGTRAQIMDVSSGLHDFLDTASVIANLDLVLTVDTSICHLAGALAANTWTLLEAAPDWRYLLEGNRSPWYQTMRLFRQMPESGWAGIADDVILALEAEYVPAPYV